MIRGTFDLSREAVKELEWPLFAFGGLHNLRKERCRFGVKMAGSREQKWNLMLC